MIIANFREYINNLREIFLEKEPSEVSLYMNDLKNSGLKEKEEKEKLKREITLINKKIEQLRDEIKKNEDKKKLSTQTKRLKQSKMQLVQKLKAVEKTSRFSTLSHSSKVALCTLKILRKYLTQELLQNEFLNFKRDIEGNVIFDKTAFTNSHLYQEARHVYDYVDSYLRENPLIVTKESYFNKFFETRKGWSGILEVIDAYFEKLNKQKEKKTKEELAAESRRDLRVIKKYPKQKVALVRLLSEEALDYEGRAMHNCVGGGTYDKLINKDKSGIYSLRLLTTHEQDELKPVVTIEYKDGEIIQVRGINNSLVPYDYNLPARKAVMFLLSKRTIQDLIDDKNLSENVLNNLGLYRDGKGGYLDIHHLTGNEDFILPEMVINHDSLNGFDFDKLKLKKVIIKGGFKVADSKELSRFQQTQEIVIQNLAEDIEIDVQTLKNLQSLKMSAEKPKNLFLKGRNTSLQNVSLSRIHLRNKESFFTQFPQTRLQVSYVDMDANDCIIFLKNGVKLKECTLTDSYVDFSKEDCSSGIIDLKELKFQPNTEIKFPRIVYGLKLSSLQNIKLTECLKVKELELGAQCFMEKFDDFLKNIDVKQVEVLSAPSPTVCDRFPNLKKFSTTISESFSVPPTLEGLDIQTGICIDFSFNASFPKKNEEQICLDFSKNHRLKKLKINSLLTRKKISLQRLPKTVESLALEYDNSEIERLNFNIEGLKELSLTIFAPNLKEVILPESLEKIDAKRSDVGIGIVCDFQETKNIKFKISETASPKVIAYLQEQWGTESVILTKKTRQKQKNMLHVPNQIITYRPQQTISPDTGR